MIYYKNLSLYTTDEYKLVQKDPPDHHLHMIGDMHLAPNTSVDKIFKAVGLEEKGQFDSAVPQSWFDEHYNEFKDEPYKRAIWYYPRDTKEEGHIFGRPVRIYTLLQMLRGQICQEAFEFWKEAHNEEG